MGTTLWSILSILLVVEKFISYSERKPIKGSGKKERVGLGVETGNGTGEALKEKKTFSQGGGKAPAASTNHLTYIFNRTSPSWETGSCD